MKLLSVLRILILALILYGIPSLSYAIRIIGNGGGYGEMQALSALAQLKDLTLPCLLHAELCPLEPEEHRLLKFLYQQRLLETQGSALEFFTDLNSGDWLRYQGVGASTLMLSSPALYTSENTPKPFGELAAMVFISWLGRAPIATALNSAGFDPQLLRNLADKIFLRMRTEDRRIDLPKRKVSVHELTIRRTDVDWGTALLTLEAEQGSHDLTPQLRQALPCTEARGAQITKIWGLSFQEPFLVGQVGWNCGDQSMTARMNAEWPKEATLEEFLRSPRFRISRMTPQSQSLDCRDLMAPPSLRNPDEKE